MHERWKIHFNIKRGWWGGCANIVVEYDKVMFKWIMTYACFRPSAFINIHERLREDFKPCKFEISLLRNIIVIVVAITWDAIFKGWKFNFSSSSESDNFRNSFERDLNNSTILKTSKLLMLPRESLWKVINIFISNIYRCYGQIVWHCIATEILSPELIVWILLNVN